jgi:hypothetical protein
VDYWTLTRTSGLRAIETWLSRQLDLRGRVVYLTWPRATSQEMLVVLAVMLDIAEGS